MADRPLLILPQPGQSVRAKRSGGASSLHFPRPERQAERLYPQFRAFDEALENRRVRLQISDPGVIPEEVAIFDIRGTVPDFLAAVNRIESLEWMGEVSLDDVLPDADFYATDRDGVVRADQRISRRLFMVFSNREAQNQVITLFRRYEMGYPLPRGRAKWASVFRQLDAVRPWDVSDRLLESGLEDALDEANRRGEVSLPCEVELWFRTHREHRNAAEERVRALVHREAGTVDVQSCVIPEIRYHALSAQLPTRTIRTLLFEESPDIELIDCEQVQHLRAAGQMAVSLAKTDTVSSAPLPHIHESRDTPVVALLDGLPLMDHEHLRARLIVDDPDAFARNYPADRRRHGTAMASLIVHGDLGAPGAPISRPIYHRPILRPDPGDPSRQNECVPIGSLVPDLIHRAVRRLFEGDDRHPPTAPDIAIVNLSIGLRNRPFGHSMTPLARLLDWLAWQHHVLFIVSAGNYSSLPTHTDREHTSRSVMFEGVIRQRGVLRAIADDTARRRLLAPAESMNAITVGAEHSDASTDPPPPRWTDPYVASGLPSPFSAHGLGYRKSVKPDILFPGGRAVVKETLPGSGTYAVNDSVRAPGQQVAAPGPHPAVLDATSRIRGTSGATALATRHAAALHDLLQLLRSEPSGGVIGTVPAAIWIKTLLAHGADWGSAKQTLREALEGSDHTKKYREFATRMLGYGAVDPRRVQECTKSRAVALGGGELREGQSHIHNFPIPKDANSVGSWKKLTITLSWFTPINARRQEWRRAHLWFGIPKQRLARTQADSRAAGRGTLQHEVWEGGAEISTNAASLAIQVSCRKDAGELEDSVPYALAMTLEVAENLKIDLYAQVRAAVDAMRVAAPTPP